MFKVGDKLLCIVHMPAASLGGYVANPPEVWELDFISGNGPYGPAVRIQCGGKVRWIAPSTIDGYFEVLP